MPYTSEQILMAIEKLAMTKLVKAKRLITNTFRPTAYQRTRKALKSPTARRIGMGAGLMGAAGAGYAGTSFLQGARAGGKVEYTDASKSQIRWITFSGGPTFIGPTSTMKELFRVGKANRVAGLKMLLSLLKNGTIKRS